MLGQERQLDGLRRDFGTHVAALAEVVRDARPILVEDRSGDPVETARATVFAQRKSRL